MNVELRVNGVNRTADIEPRKTLLDTIREIFLLNGAHAGCEHGVCGACTVLLDGEPVRSCLMFAVQVDGAELMTVEGLAPSGGDELHPLQAAFREAHALQCGFCTPGILMTFVAFLRDRPNPGEAEIRDALGGHLCRCTGYQNIVDAVKLACGVPAGR